MSVRFASVLVTAALLLAAYASSAAPLERYGVDDDHFRSLKQFFPVAAERLAQGEASLQAARTEDDVAKAVVLFDEAIAAAPSSELIRRRKCQALTILGRHADAIKACGEALHARTMSGLALRATVGALMSGTELPTGQELGMAYVHASRARQVLSSEPAGYASHCDIAEKLGDVEMLKVCIRELNRIAPEHPETARALAYWNAIKPGGGTIVSWMALVLACAITAIHALVRRGRRAVTTAALLAVSLQLVPMTANADVGPTEPEPAPSGELAKAPRAGFLSKFAIDDANPEASVPSAEQRDGDPVEYGYFIMDLADHAQWAVRDGDHKKAAHLYSALAKGVPDTAVGFVNACVEFEAAKELESAIALCSAALTTKGITLADYSHYARLLLQRKTLTATDIANLDAVVKHLKAEPGAESVALDIECTLGAHESDRARLEDCAPKLAAIAKNSPKSLFYEWALAMQQRDFSTAERVVARARTNPGAKAQVAQMERATSLAMPAWRRGLRVLSDWRVGAAITVALAAALSLLVLRRRPAPPAPSV